MRKARISLLFCACSPIVLSETTARYQRAAASDQGLPQEGKRNG
jgi:hypothetical protein